MSPLQLPVTLATACVLSLIYVVLMLRVSQLRWRHKVSLGDGGNRDLLVSCRAHANFAEYVPLILILLGMIELSNGNPILLVLIALLLVVARVLHPIGMALPSPNLFRIIGAGATFLILATLAVWGLIIVITS